MRSAGLNIMGACVACAVGAAGAGISVAVNELLPAWSAGMRAAAIGGGVAIAAGLILIPVAMLSSARMRRLGSALVSAAETGDESTVRVPGWLGAIADPFDAAVRAWRERCDSLSGRLRGLEIRLNVCEAERRHAEAILHSLQDAVVVTDSFNELSLANDSAARLLGFDVEHAVHHSIDEVISDERLRRMIKEVGRSGVLSKQKHVEHTVHGAKLSGRGAPTSFDVTIACLPDQKTDGVGGVVTILRDITREKEISEMKSDFVSQASHELRTPLSSINAYIEMLLDSEAEDEASRQEFYQIIKSEADRVARMIDNMLNISRIEAGIVQVEKAEVDFAKLTREVLDAMQPQAKSKQIKLIEKSGPLLYSAQADRDMMHQVVMNLVSNAIKYTPDGGRVTVSVENDDELRSVLVSVSDTGLGVPPDALEKLFDKFYRVENYKRIAKGTGLGLNLVKHIVETVHKGTVGVSSEVGMGSRFWFTVPYEFQGG